MANFDRIQDVLDNYKSAVYEQNVEKFLSSYSSDVHLYDCWESWECVGVSAWRENVEEWFKGLGEDGVFLKTEFSDVVITENPDLGFVHCAVTFAAYNEKEEKLRQVTNRFTFCLKREKGSWSITHEHSSLPIDHETGKGLFNLS